MPRINSKQFYTSAISMYGTSPKGVNWTSQQTQELRFDVLLSLLPNTIDSLVDAGCGFGDFYLYMKKKKRLPSNYLGIDSLVQMQSIASHKTQKEILLADVTKDSIPHADYYVCSGAMNILQSFETHLFIRNCFNASRQGFVFNLLYGEKKSQTYNYVTRSQIDKIAQSLNVTRVETRDDYMQNDITVGFFHV